MEEVGRRRDEAGGVTPASEVRVVLSEEQRDAASRGEFVRVDLGSARDFGGGMQARTALVAKVDGEWRAFANVCRHRAIPLDLGARTPMADDRVHLLCHQHGARYRPSDGLCVSGPCEGERLVRIPIACVEHGTEAVLALAAP
jgi:nitrite reductase/ring-hydroxylating ferredoxin subunit